MKNKIVLNEPGTKEAKDEARKEKARIRKQAYWNRKLEQMADGERDQF